MVAVRVAFDPSLPVVASQAFTTGGRAFADGDPFPWRDVDGMNESQLMAFWRSGLVHFVLPPADAASFAAMVSPGDTVSIETPEQFTAAKNGRGNRHPRK